MFTDEGNNEIINYVLIYMPPLKFCFSSFSKTCPKICNISFSNGFFGDIFVNSKIYIFKTTFVYIICMKYPRAILNRYIFSCRMLTFQIMEMNLQPRSYIYYCRMLSSHFQFHKQAIKAKRCREIAPHGRQATRHKPWLLLRI